MRLSDLAKNLDADPNKEFESAWGQEVLRRVEELESGRVQTIPWSDAREMIVDDTVDS